MGKLLGNSRDIAIIAFAGLLLASLAVYVYRGILTVDGIIEAFQNGFNTEQAGSFSSGFIEVIDLFIIGTVMFMTCVGLYERFVDPKISISKWLPVAKLDQLQFNLVAVIIFMLMVLCLGGAAATLAFENGLERLYAGSSIAPMILAGRVAVLFFKRFPQPELGHEPMRARNKAEGEFYEVWSDFYR